MTGLLQGILLTLVRILVGAKATWTAGDPSSEPAVYFANHASHLDTLVVLAALPAEIRATAHPVAAMDYWGRNRLTRFVAQGCLSAVLLDRKPKKGAPPLAPLEDILARNESLVLFPEGTRGDDEVADFKGGLFHLARRFPDVRLVPVHMDNLNRILPKGSMLIVPLICTVRIGAPISLADGETKADFLQRARDAVIALAPVKREDG